MINKEPKVKGDQIDLIVEHLVKSGQMKATHLGKFKVITVKAHKKFDVSKGKVAVFKPYNKVKFTATKSLKDALNK